MRRRGFISAVGAAALARPALAQTAGAGTLRFLPIADLGVLDPIVTTTYITRNHGYLVWDTLYGLDEQVRARPQMAEGHSVEEDGKRVSIRLRPGLRFHDGAPVLARDCVASIRRWGGRDGLGRRLLAAAKELKATAPDAFVLELAHYEWVELALDVSDAQLPERGWSPLAWPLAYRWPVAEIGPGHLPQAAPEQPTLILARRGADRRTPAPLGRANLSRRPGRCGASSACDRPAWPARAGWRRWCRRRRWRFPPPRAGRGRATCPRPPIG